MLDCYRISLLSEQGGGPVEDGLSLIGGEQKNQHILVDMPPFSFPSVRNAKERSISENLLLSISF